MMPYSPSRESVSHRSRSSLICSSVAPFPYNAGPERVARLGRIPQIAETQAYVAGVVECYLALSAGRAVRTAGDCRRAGR